MEPVYHTFTACAESKEVRKMNAKTDDPIKVRSLHIGQRQIQCICISFSFYPPCPFEPSKEKFKSRLSRRIDTWMNNLYFSASLMPTIQAPIPVPAYYTALQMNHPPFFITATLTSPPSLSGLSPRRGRKVPRATVCCNRTRSSECRRCGFVD